VTDDDEKSSYAWPNIAAEQMASLFATSAAFVRAAPWALMPESRGPVAVAMPSLGLPDAVVAVTGDLAESFGFLVFKDIEEHTAFLDVMDASAAGVDESFPWHLALHLEPGPELIPELRREVAQNGWEVEAKQYPWVVAVDGDQADAPDAAQLRVVEAVLGALAVHASSLSCASRVRLPSVQSYTVETHAGPVEITLADPHDAREKLRALEAPFDIELSLNDTNDAHDNDADLDDLDQRLTEYNDQLMARFEASPERATLPFDAPMLVPFLIDATFDECDGGVTKLHAEAFRRFLFELTPKYAIVNPVDTAALVKELRAFLEYLKRQFSLRCADECLAVLDHRIVPNLRKALSDRSKWSTEKRETMGALPASFSARRR